MVYWKRSSIEQCYTSFDDYYRAGNTRLLVELKDKLTKEGFNTRWLNPLIELDTSMLGTPKRQIRLELFVTDPLFPPIVPYGKSIISFSIDRYCIRFCLSLSVPIKSTESAVTEGYDNNLKGKVVEWTNKIEFYFKDIIVQFSVELDVFDITEYVPDHPVEYNFYGEFPVGVTGEVVSLMREVKKRCLEWTRDSSL